MESVAHNISQATAEVVQTCQASYGLAAVCCAVGVGVLAVVAPAAIMWPALGLAGFGANGVALGSVASGVQSGIGSVGSPSLFAMLQSAGAGGYGVAAVSGAVQAAGGIVATGAFAWLKKKAES